MSTTEQTQTRSKPHVEVELNGQTFESIRVASVQDQLQWSKSARANGWDREDEGLATIFMAWFAGKRAGHWDLTWDEFAASDAYVSEGKPPAQEREHDDDPS